MSEMFSNYCSTRRLQTPQQFKHVPRTPTGRLNSSMEAVVKKQTRNQSLGFHGNWSLFTGSFLAMQSHVATPLAAPTSTHHPVCSCLVPTREPPSVGDTGRLCSCWRGPAGAFEDVWAKGQYLQKEVHSLWPLLSGGVLPISWLGEFIMSILPQMLLKYFLFHALHNLHSPWDWRFQSKRHSSEAPLLHSIQRCCTPKSLELCLATHLMCSKETIYNHSEIPDFLMSTIISWCALTQPFFHPQQHA